MFSLYAGKLKKLIGLGFPPQWANVLRELMGNPNQPLLHKAPISIQLPSGSQVRTAAGTLANLPADASAQAPALSLDGFEGHALFVSTGATNVQGSGMTVGAPSVFNNYTTHNFPVAFFDDIRMMGEGIYKYGTKSKGSTVARMHVTGTKNGDGSYQAYFTDKNLVDYGPVQTVYDNTGVLSPPSSCAVTKDSNTYAWCLYLSELAAGGPLADIAVRPNLGAWEVLAASAIPKCPPDYTDCSFTFVSNICCVNGNIVVCTRTVQSCWPVKVGASDCGGSGCS